MEKVILINVFVTVCLFSDLNARPAKPNCPPDKPTVYCFVNPCDESSCAVKGSSCRSNSCGGCHAIWSDPSGTHLDDVQCTTTPNTTPTTTPKPSTTTRTTPTTTPKPSTTIEELQNQLRLPLYEQL
ncbi:G8 domain-containing protein DDB_G0286311-like [Mizuhopecten yessoensis]|uniref:G8 domain-containing protein DDB_G0286311-like n=1 Tax=Mizuhopecten yessoensis TaxID=6573 RepID=UPI000B45CFCE|nr:G8 domain-containing protein DDB_G0286311-like [Mizuhopecten yessoensis]